MSATFWSAFLDLKLKLKKNYGDSEAESIAQWIIEAVSGFSNTQFVLNRFELLSSGQKAQLKVYEQQLLANRPVQYVLGTSYFYGLKLAVDESVLIPRPETEELVDWCLHEVKNFSDPKLRILDIGTGSGCIALALKSKMPDAEVYAVDCSEKALATAGKNAADNNLSIRFQQLDILNKKEWAHLPRFDVIISNPPYITVEEQSTIAASVLDYEPHGALFVKDRDPLQFYKKIEAFAHGHLKLSGSLFLELHAQFSDLTLAFYEERAWKTRLKNDMQGKERMLMAYRVKNHAQPEM